MGGAASVDERVSPEILPLIRPPSQRESDIRKSTVQSESPKSISDMVVFDQFLAKSSIVLFQKHFSGGEIASPLME